MKTLKTWAAAAAILAVTGTAQAALVNLGDGTVKDELTNLIWLQNWNVNGLNNREAHRAWAASYDFAGSTDWRLPSVEEGVALVSAYGSLLSVSPFTNVRTFGYWSDSDPEPGINPDVYGMLFSPLFPSQNFSPLGTELYAVAVRSGGMATSVPEPQTWALALLALGASVVARKRPV
jgi:MYXO-CTERM domain-containing protein